MLMYILFGREGCVEQVVIGKWTTVVSYLFFFVKMCGEQFASHHLHDLQNK